MEPDDERLSAESVAPKRRRWLHIACTDTVMRDRLRLVPAAMIGTSALDVLDGLVNIIDAQQRLIDGTGTENHGA